MRIIPKSRRSDGRKYGIIRAERCGTIDAVCGQSSFIPSALDKAKNGAYANACDAAKCDQIVGAKYKVTTKNYFVFKQFNAEISGYPATLSGVELIENKTPCCIK